MKRLILLTFLAATGLLAQNAVVRVGDNATTATALAADPSACSALNFVTDIAANGGLTCAQVLISDITVGASAALDAIINDDTGGGVLVFNDTPTLLTPLFTTSLTQTGDAADASDINLLNAATIGWEASPAGTDVTISVDAAEVFVIAGASAIALPTDTSPTPTVSGHLVYDSTSNTFVAGVNTATKTLAFTDSNITGNAATATALASNPSDCSANQFANAIAANGNLTCAAIAMADLPTVFDLGGFTSLEIPNGAAVVTSVAGEIAFDTNAMGTGRGAIQVYDGTANALVLAVQSSDTPTSGQVPKINADGTITWENDTGGTGTHQNIQDCKNDWGAVGNGSANDTTAIQNCVNAAAVLGAAAQTGGIAYLPPGAYLVSAPIVLPHSTGTPTTTITLMGAGPRASEIEASGTAGFAPDEEWLRSDTTMTSIAVSSNTATLTLGSASAMTTGDRIRVIGATVDTDLNGIYTVTKTDTTHFTFTTASVADATYTESTLQANTLDNATIQWDNLAASSLSAGTHRTWHSAIRDLGVRAPQLAGTYAINHKPADKTNLTNGLQGRLQILMHNIVCESDMDFQDACIYLEGHIRYSTIDQIVHQVSSGTGKSPILLKFDYDTYGTGSGILGDFQGCNWCTISNITDLVYGSGTASRILEGRISESDVRRTYWDGSTPGTGFVGYNIINSINTIFSSIGSEGNSEDAIVRITNSRGLIFNNLVLAQPDSNMQGTIGLDIIGSDNIVVNTISSVDGKLPYSDSAIAGYKVQFDANSFNNRIYGMQVTGTGTAQAQCEAEINDLGTNNYVGCLSVEAATPGHQSDHGTNPAHRMSTATVTAAATITIPGTRSVVITGNTNIDTINVCNSDYEGRIVSLFFTGTPTVGDLTGNVNLPASFTPAGSPSNAVLNLMCRSSVWYGMGSSDN